MNIVKKSISLFLSTLMVMSSFSIVDFSAFATESVKTQGQGESNDAFEEYFEPIVINDNITTKGGGVIDTIVENGNIYIDTKDLRGADIEVSEGNDYCFISSETQELLLTEDEVVASDSSNPDVIKKDGDYYITIEDARELFGLAEEHRNGDTVLAKPFQTKKLFVKSGGIIPNVDETNKYKENGYTVLEFNTQEETEGAYNTLIDSKSVKSVTGENVYSTTAFENQSYEGLSWGSDYINSKVITEWIDEQKHEEVVVAVIDTGISSSHCILNDRISDKSCSLVTSSYEDKNGHGTHCAGIVVDNTPSNVTVMAVQGLSSKGSGTDERLAKCIDYAVKNGADVISMSWGGYSYWTETVLKTAIKNAYDSGVILVAAAGNENYDANYYYPANSNYCITVGATNSNGVPASFSNYGKCVDVSAPGVDIKSTYINNNYITYSGTSMATPFVAGECATIISARGKQTNDDMKNIVKKNVTRINNTRNNKNYGTGIIDYTFLYDGEFTSPVKFSVKSGYVDTAFNLELTCADSDAKIYYTLSTIENENTVKPSDKTAILYTEPITISDSTLIRAIAYCDGKHSSKITKGVYRFNDYDFSSNYLYDNSGTLTGYIGEQLDLAVPEYINGVHIISVGKEAFKGSKLTSLILPDSVTALGDGAFMSSRFEKIVARGVTKIPRKCFEGIGSHLKVLEVAPITSIGSRGFHSLDALDFSNLNFSKLTYLGESVFTGSSIVEADFPLLEGILPTETFYLCNELLSVSMPKVTAVGGNSLNHCVNLISIDMPSLTKIYPEAIEACTSLTNCYFPNLTEIGEAGIRGCTELTVFEAERLEKISKEAFRDTKAREYYFPNCTEVGGTCFSNCKNLESLILGDIKVIPEYMLDGCKKITEIPDCLKNAVTVAQRAFRNTPITRLDMPYAEKIDQYAFEGCDNIEEINVPNIKHFGYQEINNEKLTTLDMPEVIECGGLGCEYLISANLPKCKTILPFGFDNCTALESVYAPECIEVQDYAFDDCVSLKDFTFKNVRKIGIRCFNSCKSLKYVFLDNCDYLSNDSFSPCEGLEVFSAPKLSTKVELNSKNLKAFNMPLVTELYSSISNNGGEFYLPNVEKLHINKKCVGVNFHLPSLKNVYYDYYGTIDNIAVPVTVQALEKGINSNKLTDKVNIYTANLDITVQEKIIDYEIHGPIKLQRD